MLFKINRFLLLRMISIFFFLIILQFNCSYFSKEQLLYEGEKRPANKVARIINPIKGIEVISSFRLSKVAIRITRIGLKKIGSRVEIIEVLPGTHTIISEIISVARKGGYLQPVKANGFYKIVYDFKPGVTYKPMYRWGISYHSSIESFDVTDAEFTINLLDVNNSSIVAEGEFIKFKKIE